MNKIFNAASVVFGVICGIANKIFGTWDGALWALVVIMALDYVTGVIKAVYTKTVSSETGYKGILKKIMILVVVALANTVTNLTGGNMAVREVVIMFYIANEGISIIENAAAVSPNMPQKLKDILLQIRGNEYDNRN